MQNRKDDHMGVSAFAAGASTDTSSAVIPSSLLEDAPYIGAHESKVSEITQEEKENISKLIANLEALENAKDDEEKINAARAAVLDATIHDMKFWESVNSDDLNRGANAGKAVYAGLYKLKYKKDILVYFKQEQLKPTISDRVSITAQPARPDNAKNITEVVAGMLSRRFNPEQKEYFAEVQFAHAPDRSKGVYIASVAIPNKEDLGTDARLAHNRHPSYEDLRDKYGLQSEDKNRIRAAGSWNKHPLQDVVASGRYRNLNALFAMAVLLDDPDIHYANIVVAPGKADKAKDKYTEVSKMDAYRIDYAASFGAHNKFDGKTHMYDGVDRYPPAKGPTNHINEYPTILKISKEFAVELDKLANIDPSKVINDINDVIEEVAKFYDADDIKDFANKRGAAIPSKETDKARIVAATKKYFTDQIIPRQQDLKKVSLEIKLSLCFKSINENNPKLGFKVVGEKTNTEFYNLLTLIDQNRDFFPAKIEEFTFRTKGQEYFQEELTSITQKIADRYFELEKAIGFNPKESKIALDIPVTHEIYDEKKTDLLVKIRNNLDKINSTNIKTLLRKEIRDEINTIEENYRKISQQNKDLKTLSDFSVRVEKIAIAFDHLHEACQATTTSMWLEKVYNHGNKKYRSWKSAFFGLPSDGSILNKCISVIMHIPETVLNIFKLGTEVVPTAISKSLRWLLNDCINYFKDPRKTRNIILDGILLLVMALVVTPAVASLFAISKAVTLIGKRITSPHRSLHEAYSWGKEKYGRGVGIFMACLSAVVSITASAALATLIAPLAMVSLAKIPYVPAVFNWFTGIPGISHIGNYISQGLGFVGNLFAQAVSKLGLNTLSGYLGHVITSQVAAAASSFATVASTAALVAGSAIHAYKQNQTMKKYPSSGDEGPRPSTAKVDSAEPKAEDKAISTPAPTLRLPEKHESSSRSSSRADTRDIQEGLASRVVIKETITKNPEKQQAKKQKTAKMPERTYSVFSGSSSSSMTVFSGTRSVTSQGFHKDEVPNRTTLKPGLRPEA